MPAIVRAMGQRFAVRALMLAGLIVAFGGIARAESGLVSVPTSAASLQRFWTPQRILSAKPMTPIARPGLTLAPVASPEHEAASTFAAAAPPTVTASPDMTLRLWPKGTTNATTPDAPPPNFYDNGYYSESRVFPVPTAVPPAYPFPESAVGQLYYVDAQNNTHACTAAVLTKRIVVTAAHCIAHASTTASGRYFYSGFGFYPSRNGANAPLGLWGFNSLNVPATWYNSDGSFPNKEDWGFLVAVDTGGGKKIADLTGHLGYQTNSLHANHVTMLAYPYNFDGDSLMQRSDAANFASAANNTWIFGSNFYVGADGGPWIQNFGVAPTGGVTPSNMVVAVGSYFPPNFQPGYMGASEFNADFVTQLKAVCAKTAGNC